MTERHMSTMEILERLVAFPTVSSASNLGLVNFVSSYLSDYRVACELLFNAEGDKASLHATIGPDEPAGGVLLSGHTDVVPADGQNWSSDPYRLDLRDGRLYGRGTADMKGFLASVLAKVPAMTDARLSRPIHLVFSYDEEVGCLGVRPTLDRLRERGLRPEVCIVGEPTEMRVATAHIRPSPSRV